MKLRPIIFSTAMVRAILDGTKTQTRRIVKFSKKIEDPKIGFSSITPKGKFEVSGIHEDGSFGSSFFQMPYQKSDVLYVRETWAPLFDEHGNIEDYCYKADYSDEVLKEKRNTGLWKPSIHMPKEAARLFLQVESVKVERLQDITEQDAIAEGINNIFSKMPEHDPCWEVYELSRETLMAPGGHWESVTDSPIDSFRSLWQSINADRAPWESNPWVWVVEFSRTSNPATP